MLLCFALGLDVIELIMGIEEAFDITLTDEETEEVETVGLMYMLLCDKLGLDPTAPEAAPTKAGWTQGKVWDTLCTLTAEQTHVTRADIHFDTRFFDDLGMG